MEFLVRFIRAERGATAIEYGLLAALIVVAILGGLVLMFQRIGDTLRYVSGALGAG